MNWYKSASKFVTEHKDVISHSIIFICVVGFGVYLHTQNQSLIEQNIMFIERNKALEKYLAETKNRL
jgi:hypothetical protein